MKGYAIGATRHAKMKMKTKLPRLTIEYVSWAGHPQDRKQLWRAHDKDVDYDFGTRSSLTKHAQRLEIPYRVMRHHKNGKVSVVEKWPDKKPT